MSKKFAKLARTNHEGKNLCVPSWLFEFASIFQHIPLILEMSKPGDDDYHSSEDEDYKLPEDAPPENENDAYLIKNEEETTPKSSEPIR